jgi:GMP synthase (glutamine-hydrolysing)
MPVPETERAALVVQHVAVEGAGVIGDVLRRRRVPVRLVGPDEPLPVEAVRHALGIVVLGGPMGVYDADDHPRLRDELALLERAVAAGTPVLGICLGSQLLAAALGARVYRAPRKEIGWLDVTLQPAAREDALLKVAPPRFPALHWHGDVFDLPAGARHLASSEQTAHQAFAHGRAWGLLFHLEALPAQVSAMARAFPDELAEAGVSPDSLVVSTRRFAADAERLGSAVFDRWADLLCPPASHPVE